MMKVLLVLLLCVGAALGQIAVDHVGNYEDTVDGYRFQYHDDINMLMIINNLDCFVSDLQRHTPLADSFENPDTRADVERKIIELINQHHYASTNLGTVLQSYHDSLLRALCYRAEMYKLDISSLVTAA